MTRYRGAPGTQNQSTLSVKLLAPSELCRQSLAKGISVKTLIKKAGRPTIVFRNPGSGALQAREKRNPSAVEPFKGMRLAGMDGLGSILVIREAWTSVPTLTPEAVPGAFAVPLRRGLKIP